MRPKGVGLLYQMESREIKMHRGFEKRFDRRRCRLLDNFCAGAVSAEMYTLAEYVEYLCRRRRAILKLPALTLFVRPRSPQKDTAIDIPYFSYCQQIPHKRPQTIDDNANKKCLWRLSLIWLLRLCRMPALLSKTEGGKNFSRNSTSIAQVNTRAPHLRSQLYNLKTHQGKSCLHPYICRSQLFKDPARNIQRDQSA